jgi:hypothetical protein
MHMIEVDRAACGVFLDAERTNDKCALFVGWRHIQLASRSSAARSGLPDCPERETTNAGAEDLYDRSRHRYKRFQKSSPANPITYRN